MGDPITLTQHVCGLMKKIAPVSLHPHVPVLWQDTLFHLHSSPVLRASCPCMCLSDSPGDDCQSWHILDSQELDRTSFQNLSCRTFSSTYLNVLGFQVCLVVSKLLVLPVDQYLHPVIPNEHLPDLLPEALLLGRKLLLIPRTSCRGSPLMDLANSLSHCPSSTRHRSVRVLITPLVVPTGISSDRSLMPRKMPSKNVSSMFPQR